jgi:hypothetical protein
MINEYPRSDEREPHEGGGVRRHWIRTAGLLGLLVLVAASCNPPGETVGTGSETVGRQGEVEFVDGVIERQVRVAIPAGALEGAEGGVAEFGVSTSTPEPISAVEVDFGGSVEGEAVVDHQGNYGFDLDWTIPNDCDNGCEVIVPVTFRHVGDGDEPGFVWSMSFTIGYESVVPPEAEDMDAVIESPGGG